MVLEAEPQNIKAMNRKGQIYNFRKEYHKAIDAYKLTLQVAPENATAKQGLQATQQNIAMNMNNTNDEERVRRAMADPEIATIM